MGLILSCYRVKSQVRVGRTSVLFAEYNLNFLETIAPKNVRLLSVWAERTWPSSLDCSPHS